MTFLYKADPARRNGRGSLRRTRQKSSFASGLTSATPPQFAISPRMSGGPHLNRDDRLAALASGSLRGATLDVTDPEPLTATHALWGHPRVRITPHIASATRPDTAVNVVIENICRHRAGDPLLGEIDCSRGY